MTDGLTQAQLLAITNIERACSILSIVGCIFVIVTFCFSNGFRKPINRLVFYATLGNMMTNVGTLMSRTYIESPSSVGCQFQAFLIQMYVTSPSCQPSYHMSVRRSDTVSVGLCLQMHSGHWLWLSMSTLPFTVNSTPRGYVKWKYPTCYAATASPSSQPLPMSFWRTIKVIGHTEMQSCGAG